MPSAAPPAQRAALLPAAVGLLAFLLYALTAAPSITWRNGGIDSAELATAAATGSVAHPPGYPTYLLLGRLALALPTEPARALTWLSALGAAMTCAAVVAAAQRQTFRLGAPGSPGAPAAHLEPLLDVTVSTRTLVSAAPGLWLATAPLLWASATYAEVNAPMTAVAALWLALRGWETRPARHLGWIGALLGLSLGIHMLLSVLIVGTALGQVGPRRLARLAALFSGVAIGASLAFGSLALFPPSGPVNWYAPQTRSGWSLLVTADAYRGLLSPGGAPLGFLAMLRLVVENLGFVGAIAAVVGVQEVLARRAQRPADGTLRCAAVALVYVLFAAAYAARDAEAYLLPGLVLLTPAAVRGLHAVTTTGLPRVITSVALAGAVLAPSAANVALHGGRLNLSADRAPAVYATQVLTSAPPAAVLVTSGDAATFALWYARYARGDRPDVAVLNEDLLPRDWYRAHLARIHPDLRLPPGEGVIQISLPDVMALNPSRRVLPAPSPPHEASS